MTTEQFRPLLDDMRSLRLFFRVSERLARAKVLEGEIGEDHGAVEARRRRGIVAGDVVRRLVAQTFAKQLSTAVERSTSPHQNAVTTRAGCECVAHVLQSLIEVDPLATVTSIDGTSIFDLISGTPPSERKKCSCPVHTSLLRQALRVSVKGRFRQKDS